MGIQRLESVWGIIQGMSPTREDDYGLPSHILKPRQTAEFESLYNLGTPPWDIGRPQGAFQRLADAGALQGRVLDVGCGTGEHTLLAARLGLDATGVDLAKNALHRAGDKARERGLRARFLPWDALQLTALGERFDTALDCGLFHVFEDADRPRFVEGLGAVMAPGGRYFMLCFSDRQPGEAGPRRVTQAELKACFSNGWRVDSIEPAIIELHQNPVGAQSWLASFTRL